MQDNMQFPKITKLYIYKPANEYTLKIVNAQSLWASKPKHFNDPFDCELEIADPVTEESVRAKLERRHGDSSNWADDVSSLASTILDANGEFTPAGRIQIEHDTQKLIFDTRNSGIVCLSERPDSILMWSHYASSHTGVCFQFERNPTNSLGDDGLCSPVIYSDAYPKINLGRMLTHADGSTFDMMMRYKSVEWAYEKEWRLITDRGDANCPLPGKLERVIFGLRVDASYKTSMSQLCDRHGIQFTQAKKVERQLRIEIPA